MARKPRKRTPKTPSVAQRLKAQARTAAKSSNSDAARGKRDVRVDKAQLAWSRRQYDEAIRHYEAALARNPRDPVLLVDVARAYALRFRYDDAEKLIELAQRLYPDDANLQRMLARSYGQVQQFDRAIGCYRRSLELQPESPERFNVLLELAKMLERLHQLDDARQCVEEALRLGPSSSAARFTLARIERRQGDVSAAESHWRDLITGEHVPPGIAADSGYELAALLDAAGQFDEAYATLVKAKAILDSAAIPYREEAEELARTSRTTFAAIQAEHVERWSAAGASLKPMQGPLALLTSHPRSGTTLLEQVLDSHPQAISADELQVMAEMVYVPLGQKAGRGAPVVAALDQASVDDLNRVRHSYWSSMEGALRQPVAGRTLIDKNPELTLLLPLVARVFPEMSIIFALRDPRDVILSCFMQRLPLNTVSVHYLTLEAAAKKYAANMRAWLKIRDMLRNRWLEVRYEDCVADLKQQAQRVLEFLNLPWDDQVLDYHRRAQTKHVHSPTYEAVTKPVYSSSVGRWRNYEAQLAPVMGILQPYVDAFGYA
ncbi:MAG TPA: sulfotransferase [Lacipirellula sp.]